ncbi:MAG TPA: hypothetical protein PKD98_00035 [Anaerolineae bacterium]|nr:hypothetical protein [Anaerolineae bacterium]
MNNHSSPKIDKQYISALVSFAIRHIPQADEQTLNKFLELLRTNGGFGSVTLEQLINTMRLTLKYVPQASASSLLTLLELIGAHCPLELQITPHLLQPGSSPAPLFGANRPPLPAKSTPDSRGLEAPKR